MKSIYILSGLGADKRAFVHLDFGMNQIHFIDWIEPNTGETIENYAQRLAQQILHKSPILVGLSFGGMMAVEIAKIISVEKVILISSAKNCKEIPFYFQLCGKLRLDKIVPVQWLKWPNRFTFCLFGAKTAEQKRILTEILQEIDSHYLRWSISKILDWKNNQTPAPIFHIHGRKDYLLPLRCVKANRTIANAGHLMLLSHFQEINEIIRIELKE